MNKKTARIVCIVLAALMLLTTFGMLFAELTFAVTAAKLELYNGEAPKITVKDTGANVTTLAKDTEYEIKIKLATDIAKVDSATLDANITSEIRTDFAEESAGTFAVASEAPNGKLVLDITLYVKWTGPGKKLSLDLKSFTYNGTPYSGSFSHTFNGLKVPDSGTDDNNRPGGYSWYGDIEFNNSSSRSIREGRTYEMVFSFVDRSITFSDMDPMYYTYDPSNGSIVINGGMSLLEGFVEENGGNFSVLGAARFELLRGNADPNKVDGLDQNPVFRVTVDVTPDGAGKRLSIKPNYDYYDTDGRMSHSSGELTQIINSVRLSSDNSSSEDEDENDSYKTATPNVIITSYSYGGIDVLSGSEFPLTITFQNTSDELELENVILDLVTSTGLAVSSGSNSAFLERLGPGESQTREFKMMALANLEKIEPQQITAKFSWEYILDKARKPAERTEVLAVPVTQVDRFEVGELSVPDQMWPGDSNYFSVEYVNKGKGVIANLAAKLETNIPGVGETQNLGNVAAGDSGSIDFNMTVNEPGTVQGKVIITYEDLKGQEQTIELPFTSTVMDTGGMGAEDPGVMEPMPMPEETGIPLATKVMAVVGGLMVAGLTGTVVVKKVKAKREEEQDEDI